MPPDSRRPLLIVLKTRNEPAALARWLTHHRAFVEAGAVVIFDNASNDPRVDALYAGLRDRVEIRLHHGFHNLLHEPERNRALYAELFSRARHVVFLDTDEWLYATDGKRLQGGEGVLDLLASCPQDTLFPGLWLQNRDGTAREFHVNDGKWRMREARKWGKPVIPTAPGLPRGFINHTIQLLEHNDYPSVCGGIVVAHLSMLDAAERINANLNKLMSKGFIRDHAEWPGAAHDAARLAAADPHVQAYVAETLDLMKPGALAYVPPKPGEGGWAALEDDGTLRFADEATARAFAQAVAYPLVTGMRRP